jgi:ketosteroid isomerase-like protein
MSAHTPGPWTVADNNEVHCDAKTIAMVADLNWGQYRDAEDNGEAEFEANARLIAAAPELLEALKALTDADTDFTRAWAKEAARAAIAKATGEKQ